MSHYNSSQSSFSKKLTTDRTIGLRNERITRKHPRFDVQRIVGRKTEIRVPSAALSHEAIGDWGISLGKPKNSKAPPSCLLSRDLAAGRVLHCDDSDPDPECSDKRRGSWRGVFASRINWGGIPQYIPFRSTTARKTP